MSTALVPARGPTFLRAAWRSLVLLNWRVDPNRLHGVLPAGVALDPDPIGDHWVSVVGFRFEDTRVLGVRWPGHVRFEEVNLRFYVRRMTSDPRTGAAHRRGVCFVREIVPRAAIAWSARLLYNEPYVAWPMDHDIRVGPSKVHTDALPAGSRVSYGWRPPGGQRTEVWAELAGERAEVPGPESHEAWIAEHYWGYCAQRSGRTVEYAVEHPAWAVWSTRAAGLRGDVAATWGPRWAEVLERPPDTAFVAEGSPVAVGAGRRT